MLAIDGSELANRAVDQGLELARVLGARVTAVNVTEPWTAVVTGEGALGFPLDDYNKTAAANSRERPHHSDQRSTADTLKWNTRARGARSAASCAFALRRKVARLLGRLWPGTTETCVGTAAVDRTYIMAQSSNKGKKGRPPMRPLAQGHTTKIHALCACDLRWHDVHQTSFERARVRSGI